MKKLTLKVSELMNPTVLNREQLKRVMGGSEVVTTKKLGIDHCFFEGVELRTIQLYKVCSEVTKAQLLTECNNLYYTDDATCV
jgi:hypothetical protein